MGSQKFPCFFAIAILSGLGYRVVASTGRLEEGDYLRELGAAEILDRRTLSEPGNPIAGERWAGAVDSVGSHTLANVVAQTQYRGVVTACGLAQGLDLPGSVLPFILRNVTLAGVDSVNAPQAIVSRHGRVWRAISTSASSPERPGYSVSRRFLRSRAESSKERCRAARSSTSMHDGRCDRSAQRRSADARS